MNCKKINILLTSYADNGISAQDKAFVEKHLAQCPKCRKEYEGIKEIKMMLSSLDKQQTPKNFESAVIGKISEGNFVPACIESFVSAAKTSMIASALLLGIIAAVSFFTPTMAAHRDNIDAMNNYVTHDIDFPYNNISNAAIMNTIISRETK